MTVLLVELFEGYVGAKMPLSNSPQYHLGSYLPAYKNVFKTSTTDCNKGVF